MEQATSYRSCSFVGACTDWVTTPKMTLSRWSGRSTTSTSTWCVKCSYDTICSQREATEFGESTIITSSRFCSAPANSSTTTSLRLPNPSTMYSTTLFRIHWWTSTIRITCTSTASSSSRRPKRAYRSTSPHRFWITSVAQLPGRRWQT